MSGQKRKRTRNTTKEQLDLYLQYMERDYHFRSGTINPTLGENYIENHWTKLCNSLNAIGDGPNLEVEEWKKRFSDWKYATRAKYRKLTQYRSQTGSGPPTTIKMSDLEERGLSVWGKVAVTGLNCSTNYEGIEIQPTQEHGIHELLPNPTENMGVFEILTVDTSTEEVLRDASTVADVSGVVTAISDTSENENKELCQKQRHSRTRQKPLSLLAEKLIHVTNAQGEVNSELVAVAQQFLHNYVEIKKEKNDIEKKRLEFEIAKFKFENPNFNFE